MNQPRRQVRRVFGYLAALVVLSGAGIGLFVLGSRRKEPISHT